MLYEGDAVSLGRREMLPGDPALEALAVVRYRPDFIFPRLPYELRFPGEEPVVADANTVVTINLHSPYQRRVILGQGIRNDWVEVDPEVLSGMMEEIGCGPIRDAEKPFAFREAPVPRGAFLMVRSYVKLIEQGGAPDRLQLEEDLLHVAAAVLQVEASQRGKARRPSAGIQTSRNHGRAVGAVKVILHSEMGTGIRLGEIARRVGLSMFHLSRVFRERTGLPIYRYLDRLRLRAALDRIPDYTGTLSALGQELGFSSDSHFSNSFLREFGVRPSRVVRDRRLWEGLQASARLILT